MTNSSDGPQTFSSYDDLLHELRKEVIVGTRTVIAIDGIDGAGKSTLAEQLASDLGGEAVSVDCYLVPNQGSYIEHIKIDELSKGIGEAQQRAEIVVVEGICALAVLDKVGTKPDIHIYVKEAMFGYFWKYGEFLSQRESAEELIELENARAKKAEECFGDQGGDSEPLLQEPARPETYREELIRYHFSWRPHEECDLVYLRKAD